MRIIVFLALVAIFTFACFGGDRSDPPPCSGFFCDYSDSLLVKKEDYASEAPKLAAKAQEAAAAGSKASYALYVRAATFYAESAGDDYSSWERAAELYLQAAVYAEKYTVNSESFYVAAVNARMSAAELILKSKSTAVDLASYTKTSVGFVDNILPKIPTRAASFSDRLAYIRSFSRHK